MQSVLDNLEDDDDEENNFEVTFTEVAEERVSASQQANQKRVRQEIVSFVLNGLGGVPPDYSRTEAKRLWGNRWRVNVITVDKNGATHYIHSYFVHYQFEHITADKQTPLTKLYSNNYEEVFLATTPLEGDQS